MKVIAKKHENGIELLSSDNTMIISDLKTFNGIRNRVLKSTLFKNLKQNEKIVVSDFDNSKNILMTFTNHVLNNDKPKFTLIKRELLSLQ